MVKHYDLAAIIEAEGDLAPLAEIALLNGDVAIVPHPLKWGDDAFSVAEHKNMVRAARAILGDGYDSFVAGGGNARRLMEIVEELGANPPESKASTDS